MAKQEDLASHKAVVKEPEPIATDKVEIEITTDRAGFGGRGSTLRVSPERAERWAHRGYAKILDKKIAAKAAKSARKEGDPPGAGEVQDPPQALPDADGKGGKNQE